ncbi:hypothetical protein SDC9_144802 [bioreactor metagenome]|uniref:Uncharacterized protein n=1 Tax=bioreactor metagenome TaxID=1076179 RepID=A0A645E742_9ZZZZ
MTDQVSGFMNPNTEEKKLKNEIFAEKLVLYINQLNQL